jgi:hypothetical protein
VEVAVGFPTRIVGKPTLALAWNFPRFPTTNSTWDSPRRRGISHGCAWKKPRLSVEFWLSVEFLIACFYDSVNFSTPFHVEKREKAWNASGSSTLLHYAQRGNSVETRIKPRGFFPRKR